MFSLFKTKQSESEPTLKARVEKFWEWYAEVAPRFYKTIEEGKCPSLAAEVIPKIKQLLPQFAWVFGPGENRKGHSFTLSGEGNLHKQLIAQYWQERAPQLSGWTFYAFRQASPIKGHFITIGERKFDPIEFWVTPNINRENENFDLVAWHPLFGTLIEQDRWTILYLFLDEVLGEYGTEQYIGKIELNSERLGESIPLQELLDVTNKAREEYSWEKHPPGKSGVVYKLPEQHDRFLRGDVIVGSTTNFKLVNEYTNAEGELSDPLAGTGADYVFVSFDSSILPQGEQSTARGAIEEALEEALSQTRSGRVFGGAHGTKRGYIDMMIFDGTNSLEIVRRVLIEKQLPAGTEIHFFAKEKRGHRIVL